jgi:hypothetical protein
LGIAWTSAEAISGVAAKSDDHGFPEFRHVDAG